MRLMRRVYFAGPTAFAVAASLVATPVAASPLSDAPHSPAQAVWSDDAVAVNQWGGWGWGGGYWGGYRRNRLNAGDVLAGVLIIGGIAAIANAATRNARHDDRYRERDYRYRDRRYQEPVYRYRGARPDSRLGESRGMDRAADMCVDAIQRNVRVAEVTGAQRTAQGWRIDGTIFDGRGFTCRIGNDGRIEGVDYGAVQPGWQGTAVDNQWDDARYATARRQADDAALGGNSAPVTDGPQPAYPGGPLPGES